jgi:hypothetical protein
VRVRSCVKIVRKHETPRIFIGTSGRAQSAEEIRERLGDDSRRACDRSQQGSTLLRGPAGRAGGVVDLRLLHNAFKAPAAQFVVYAVLVALYARTRLLKMTGKKEYYREEKTE